MKKTITLGNGKKLEAEIELRHYKQESNPLADIRGEENYWYGMRLRVETPKGWVSCTENGYTRFPCPQNGYPENVKAEIIGSTEKGEKLRIMLTDENADMVKNLIDELREEVTTEEARAFFAAREERERKKEIMLYKETVRDAEKEIAQYGSLLSRAELKEWRKNYNKMMNEGGEGYVPPRTPKEEYEQAKKMLAELERQGM